MTELEPITPLEQHFQPETQEASPSESRSSPAENNEQLVCHWNNCQRVFPDHPSLASHLSEEHVGWKKGGYYCDWNNCARQGAKCHNRFALMMHLRIHTGEKPFECNIPECGQTFGRMDALVRHKKAEHGERPVRSNPYNLNLIKKPKRPSTDALLRVKKPKMRKLYDWSSGDEMDEMLQIKSTKPLIPESDYGQYRLARAQLDYVLRENEIQNDEFY
ncbi:hypothetical protein CU098_003730 [Rhizopus stolonifer]|uniref:C2H2-type domain-containing protein n=1 Tax=Rhizopus stolonifer TaxID=4846 RepID=A0A367K8P9_RHIST|nr:hypothetical protein CU098_003730 [Rhizopus stolonifer]